MFAADADLQRGAHCTTGFNGELNQTDYNVERERGKERLRELTLSRQHASPSGV